MCQVYLSEEYFGEPKRTGPCKTCIKCRQKAKACRERKYRVMKKCIIDESAHDENSE